MKVLLQAQTVEHRHTRGMLRAASTACQLLQLVLEPADTTGGLVAAAPAAAYRIQMVLGFRLDRVILYKLVTAGVGAKVLGAIVAFQAC